MAQRSYSGLRTVKTQKFKLLYFRNESCFGAGNLQNHQYKVNK